MKIYTKTGDEGMTSLIGGTRVSKSDLRVECCGTIDELNAHAGLLSDYLKTIPLETVLPKIQNTLFAVGAALANDERKNPKISLPNLVDEDVVLLEKEIDKMSETLPLMKHFILPSGHIFISQAHVARTVCRRAERLCAALSGEKNKETLLPIIKYLNRLSDYFFVLARYIGHTLKVAEIQWIPKEN